MGNEPKDATDVDRVRTLIDLSEPSPKVAPFAAHLHARIIGQERPIRSLLRVAEIDGAGFYPIGKPIAPLLFVGPPGVGKTELAFEFAHAWIGKLRKAYDGSLLDPLTKIDAPEFVSNYDVANLRGSAKGLVGYQDETPLMQHVLDRYDFEVNLRNALSMFLRGKAKRLGKGESEVKATPAEMQRILNRLQGEDRPLKKILLVDEIERGHRSLWNLLISVMNGKGMRFTDGRTTDFTRMVMIMTSNIGEERLQKALGGRENIGFGTRALAEMDGEAQEQTIYKIVDGELKKIFPPALISRVRKNIVVFRPLQMEAWEKILDLRLGEVRAMLAEGNDRGFLPVGLAFTEPCRKLLLDEGIDHRYGARPLNEVIIKRIIMPLARAYNADETEPGDTIVFDAERKPGAKKAKIVVYRER